LVVDSAFIGKDGWGLRLVFLFYEQYAPLEQKFTKPLYFSLSFGEGWGEASDSAFIGKRAEVIPILINLNKKYLLIHATLVFKQLSH
jgi:hypothetical protein